MDVLDVHGTSSGAPGSRVLIFRRSAVTAGTRGGYTGARGKHGQRHKAAEMAAVPSGCVGGGARAEEARGAAELLVVAACDEEMREAAGSYGSCRRGAEARQGGRRGRHGGEVRASRAPRPG